MLKNAGKPYVCWRCLTNGASLPSVAGGSQSARRGLATVRFYTRNESDDKLRGNVGPFARRRHEQFELSKGELKRMREKSNIRERLRGWETENHIPSRRLFQDLPDQDIPLSNFLTRPDLLPGSTKPLGQESDESGERKTESNRALFDGDELMDLRGATSALVAGDLVETRYGAGRLPILAICLGRHHGLQYFYMSTGELIPQHSMRTLFTLPNFTDPEKFQDLVDIIPEEPVSNPRNVLAHRHNLPALKSVARLQEQLAKFYADSVSFYQAHPQLETASAQMAHPDKPQYLSLEQLADKLLPEYLKVDDRFVPHALYAVHTALQRDEWGFRPVNLKWHRRNYVYEVLSASDTRIMRKVESQVRELIEGAAIRENPAESMSLLRHNGLGMFILRMRSIIKAHREMREWTPHGMVGPSKQKPETPPQWHKQDVDYIRFMELWACHRIVTKPSQLETLGSTILRLTDMYTQSDWLAHWTGFTFLQEIGWIPPWDIPARYNYRFPDAKISRGEPIEMPSVDVDASLRPDIAAGHRRDFGSMTVFCVDDEKTQDVDDGFSIEATEKPGEYWIHVHIADPASVIDPKSDLSRRIQQAPSSLYLAGFPYKMLPRDLEQQFSLNSNRPTLTFSAKVNEVGNMLDYKIEPGFIRKVRHVPKNEIAAILPGFLPAATTKAKSHAFSVGTPPQPSRPAKKITTAAHVSLKDRDDLLLLNRLCKALKHRREAKGQLPPLEDRFASPEVSLDSVVTMANHQYTSPMTWRGDPFIRFCYPTDTEADRLVERLMHTAGEVAAKWCSARKIPVPYSTQPEAIRNAAELREFRREHIEPLAARGKPIPMELIQALTNLVGVAEISADPAPFYSVGLDAYARSSSPLRRFGDLVVHWQIHAALAQERAAGGRSLAGEDCSEAPFLPWTRSALAPQLPMLQALQRQIKDVDQRDGPMQWMTQALLRAWRFGEARLPKTFTFVVDGLYPFGLRGRLSSFYNLSASVDLRRLGNVCKLADVRVDDLFEVEIADINVVTTNISLQPLRRLKPTPSGQRRFPQPVPSLGRA